LSARALQHQTEEPRCTAFEMKRLEAGAGGSGLIFGGSNLVADYSNPGRGVGEPGQELLHMPGERPVLFRHGRVFQAHVKMDRDRFPMGLEYGLNRRGQWTRGG
jgi:hypothetical protein